VIKIQLIVFKFAKYSKQSMYKTNVFLLALSAALLGASGCSEPERKETTEQSASKPNIILIVADDLGFSDIGPFGGNTPTPTLDQFAKEGMLFSNFHVLPTCSPTRSALLTGNDNHVAGFGIMSELEYPVLTNLNLPGYAGYLSNQVVTIPEVLRENGYHTYMVGKWHLGEGEGKYPCDRGFEESFILGTGGGSHWNDKRALAPPQHMSYFRNATEVEPPQDFYSSKNYTDSLIQFIDRNKADKKPFMAFLSYTAVHDPLHVPEEYITKYKGKFDMGWDSLWVLRLTNLKSLGIIPPDANNFITNPAVAKWSTLSKEHKAELARDMEVYAGMLDYMDMSIGRFFDFLKKEGLYDNSLIVFMSDNGANGALGTTYPGNADGKYLSTFDNKMENRGRKGSFVEQGPGWAQASSSPFRFFKTFTTQGGIKAPLIVKMPGTMKDAGKWNKGFAHVTDIMPTILELAGAEYPKQHKGNELHPLIGKSLIPVLNGDSATVHTNDGMGWELFEMKAYIKNNYKILRLPVPFGTGQWQLFNLENDPGETTDLSDKFPEIKNDLIKSWDAYAKHNNVYDHNGHFDSLYRASYVPHEKND
jgi:arylsulfatase A-like enzyme